MIRDGDDPGQRQILPLGQGELDLGLLKVIRDSGYQGPIGILGHTHGRRRRSPARQPRRPGLAGRRSSTASRLARVPSRARRCRVDPSYRRPTIKPRQRKMFRTPLTAADMRTVDTRLPIRTMPSAVPTEFDQAFAERLLAAAQTAGQARRSCASVSLGAVCLQLLPPGRAVRRRRRAGTRRRRQTDADARNRGVSALAAAPG